MHPIISKYILEPIRKTHRLIILFVCVIVFFLSYNTYLIDHSLESLKFSLDGVAGAETVVATEDIGLLLDYNLLEEVSARKLDTKNLANLEYTKSVLAGGDLTRKVEDIRYVLLEVVKKKKEARGFFLNMLDTSNRAFFAAVGFLSELPSYLAAPRKRRLRINTALLAKAKEYEAEWKLDEARQAYERLIKDYPRYKKRGSLKIHLGYIYQKLQRYEDAQKVYLDVARSSRVRMERRVARKLLYRLAQGKKILTRRESLEESIREGLVSGEKLQQVLLDLGVACAELFDYEAALEAFKQAVKQNPESVFAARASFAMGWLYKYQAAFEESIATFEKLIERQPASDLVMGSRYELADTFRRGGNFEQAIAKYEELVDLYEEEEIAPLVQYQVGSTYLYDLRDGEAAMEAFRKLKEKFPTSSYAVDGVEYLKQLQVEEENLLLELEPMVLSWSEKALPEFGAVLAARVRENGKRLVGLGAEGIEASYSNEELKALIARRFKGVLPKQVQELDIRVRKGRLEAEGLLKLRKFSFRFRAETRVEVKEGRAFLSIEEVVVEDVTIPAILLTQAMRQINRALEKRNSLIEVSAVELEEGLLTVRGKVLREG